MDKLFFKMLFPLWALLLVFNFAAPKVDFSENENRKLAVLPDFSVKTLLNGKYMQKLDEYANDHFVGRDYWMAAQSTLEYAIGKRENNGVFLGRDALMADIARPDASRVEANIRGMRAFAQNIGKPCYLMLVPSAAAVQPQKLPPLAASWEQQAFIEEVNGKVQDVITPVPIFDTLSQNREEYIFYRTDHHWTTDGAFLAYTQAAPAMGLPTRTAEHYRVRTISEQFNGTLFSKSGARGITPDSIKAYDIGIVTGFTAYDGQKNNSYPSMYFDEFLTKKDKYSYFLGENQPLVSITTAAGTGKKLLMFKDSYAHSFAPFLTADYDEITLVDMRYINSTKALGELVDLKSYDDILFLYSTDVFSQLLHVSKLENMFGQ
ncbi:MAG: DHHW family protein [Angelakisella sp.]